MTTALIRCQSYFKACRDVLCTVLPWAQRGRLSRVFGMVLEAVGLKMPVGSCCEIITAHGRCQAVIVGFKEDHLLLMPLSDSIGFEPGADVIPYQDKKAMQPWIPRYGQPLSLKRRQYDHSRHGPVGPRLLGRVVDSVGQPLDDRGALQCETYAPLWARPKNPMHRAPIQSVLDVGVRAINALLTVGRGQRLGLFSGSGVGKSVLLGMMARYTQADVVVVGLIGERGREVKDFIENSLGPDGLAHSVVVAAPADTPPLLRLYGAAYATSIAEYFRAQGKHVLLIMDSLTRYAMAQREIALAVGEPPVTKGYPPSVFARLPQLVERAGTDDIGGGSITAFYTVLSEGDDQQDPIADSARAILDGHIVLSRALADAGHYPAIDIESSISRVVGDIVPADTVKTMARFKKLYTHYQRHKDLISVGAYVKGADPLLDCAIASQNSFEHFLTQDLYEKEGYETSQTKLAALIDAIQPI